MLLCHSALSFQSFQEIHLLPSSSPNTVPSVSLRHSSLWQGLLFFHLLLLSFLCSETTAHREKSTNTTLHVFPHGLIPIILPYTRRGIPTLQGKLVVTQFLGTEGLGTGDKLSLGTTYYLYLTAFSILSHTKRSY